MFLFTSVFTFFLFFAGAQETPVFRLLSQKETGIRFSNDIDETESLNVLVYDYLYNGGGVAVGDINNDGLPDLFFTANMQSAKIFLNLGNLKFKDITKSAGIELHKKAGSWKNGVTMADINGDGLLDIYVCYSGRVDEELRKNQLFINKGNLKFEEKAAEFGLDDKSYSTQAAFFDYDNDGDLDMFLLNHSTKKVDNMELARYRKEVDKLAGNKLYENQGGRFVDVSAKAGIIQSALTFGLGIAVTDIDKDGWQDIYVTNDYNEPDYLYINNRNGTFRESSRQYFRHLPQFSMGVDIADFNNDGLADIMSLDMLPEDNRRQKLLQLQENYESFQLMVDQDLNKQYMRNMLQLNNGDSTFSEIGQLAGVSSTDWSWCPLMADFDNDGYKDIFITNGFLRDFTNKDFLKYWGDYKIKKAMDREPEKFMDLISAMPSTTLTNYIFKNNHDLGFSNVVKQWGIDHPGISSGAVYVDLDNDGDLDIVVNQVNEPALIYRNMTTENNAGNFIAFRLSYKTPNINAIGAKIYIYTGGGLQYQELNPDRGFLSCVSTVINFGIGKCTGVDSVRIIWPDHTTQTLGPVEANRRLNIAYNTADIKKYIEAPLAASPLFSKAPDLIQYTSQAIDDNDFKRQLLMLFMYSKTSPVIAKGDVNKDGMDDLFISGDQSLTGKIFVQKAGGRFDIIENISNEHSSTNAAAAFFDANGDGYDDLYIAKGGYAQYEPGTSKLQDELYINDGSGHLRLSPQLLPVVNESSKSCVRPCDFDNDGDIDLFVGGRIIPGQYPVTPQSYLLVNDGKGKFSKADVPFSSAGMVTDARWVDVDNDGRKDLVLCGEFMPVTLYLNKPGGFTDATDEYFGKRAYGIWSSLQVADLDGDGNMDIIAGNIGQNTQIHISEKEPATLYYADFDNNGSIDPFLNFYIQGKSYPFVSRDELNEQIYPMRKKFTSYKAYADATMENIFSKQELSNAKMLKADENRSVVFFNRKNKFEKVILPQQAQFSVVTGIIADDFNKDGKPDLLLSGNRSDNRLKLGSIDANYGCVLINDGKGNFNYLPQYQSGLSLKGDVKSAEKINIANKPFIIIGACNEKVSFYAY